MGSSPASGVGARPALRSGGTALPEVVNDPNLASQRIHRVCNRREDVLVIFVRHLRVHRRVEEARREFFRMRTGLPRSHAPNVRVDLVDGRIGNHRIGIPRT